MNTSVTAGPRISYWALWILGTVAIFAGAVLLATRQTVVWVASDFDVDTETGYTVDLVPTGIMVTVIGALVVVTLLVLDAYVGPLHRRHAAPAETNGELSNT